ncbi:MAG: hypothetical protein ACTSPG_03475 [Candidatus Hodarchaeales archaeon]
MKIVKQYHLKIDDVLIKAIQHYDQLSARITRKYRLPVISRYNWYANIQREEIDFQKMAQEISDKESNVWKLYEYIYKSK